jgi:hypothetical protein
VYDAHIENGGWVIERKGDIELPGALYGWIPAGQPVVGTPVCEVPGGTVVKIRSALEATDSTGVPHIIEHSVLCGK